MDPEVIHERFAELVNALDIDGLTALYEPEAAIIDRGGRVIKGVAAIHDFLLQFLSLKPKITINPVRTINTGDVAILISNWEIEGTAPDGSPVNDGGRTYDVVHRQPDGSWRTVVDNPWDELAKPG